MTPKGPWYHPNYSRLVSAIHRAGVLSVEFADGTRVKVDAGRLLPMSVGAPRWEQLTHDEFELSVRVDGTTLEIPWSAIRALTDSSFETHLRASEAKQSTHIGKRIRKLREQRRTAISELAGQAGVSAEGIRRLERGDPRSTSGRPGRARSL